MVEGFSGELAFTPNPKPETLNHKTLNPSPPWAPGRDPEPVLLLAEARWAPSECPGTVFGVLGAWGFRGLGF